MTEVVVLGASLAGLWAAAAASGSGARVLLVERDPTPAAAVRPGVPQGTQPHVFLHRGLRAGADLLPGLRDDLVAAGAVGVDTGLLPWLGEHGWLPQSPSYEVMSLTRPLLEQIVRDRVLALPGVEALWGRQVVGLASGAGRWRVRTADGTEVVGSLVVDATGRSSRLRTWLADLGLPTPEPVTVDARLGYSTRLVEGGPDLRELPGVVVQATPESPVGGIALPVEGGSWLVTAMGFGDRRPPRDPDGFADFLTALPDPALVDLLRGGRPVGPVAVHRQTGNRRHRYARVHGWPDGLVALGDALCCFDPVYGQGIAVSACQALRLRTALARGTGASTTRALLRELDRTVEFPWAVAIGQDLRMPASAGTQTRAQAAVSGWASELGRRAVQGDRRARDALMRTYHLESSARALLHPALIASVARGRLRRAPVPSRRPPVLATLAR